MNPLNTLWIALLTLSNVTLAESPSDGSFVTGQAAAVLAQAAPDETRAHPDRGKRAAPSDDEALALAALEGLMSQRPERALPILKKVLSGSQTSLVKQRALFVLSQIHDPEAQAILIETTRSADPALRAEAIRNIGIGGDPKSLAVLSDVYKNGDAKTKRNVLEAWLISDSKNEVYQAALNAKTEEEANAAIRILGAMGATEELRKLGENKNAASGLVEAYAISGDLASLRKIAESDGNPARRSDAVRKIGIIDTEEARVALREIYTNAKTPEIKEAALNGMMINDDEQGVLALYRASKTTEEKRALLRTLSHMDSDAALEAIDAALGDKK